MRLEIRRREDDTTRVRSFLREICDVKKAVIGIPLIHCNKDTKCPPDFLALRHEGRMLLEIVCVSSFMIGIVRLITS